MLHYCTHLNLTVPCRVAPQGASMTSDQSGNLKHGQRCLIKEIDQVDLPGGKGKKV